MSFGSARSGRFQALSQPQDGGVVIWGQSADGRAFSLALPNDSAPAEKILPVGSWAFFAVGYTGPSTNPLEGTVRCAFAPVDVSGASLSVPINLSTSDCNHPFFASSAFMGSQTYNSVANPAPQPLRLVTCVSLGGISGGSQNCDSTARGDFLSYQVVISQFDLSAKGSPAAQSAGLTSHCFSLSTAAGNSLLDTGIRLPAGEGAGSAVVTLVRAFTDASCSSGEVDYEFRGGLQGGSTSGFSSVYSYGGTTVMFLGHGVLAAPTSVTLIAPAASPGNMASPVVQVGGVASGDTVSIYDNSSCTGTALGSGTSGGTALNVTSSALADASTTTIYAMRSNGGATSACSTASVTYVTDLTAPGVSISSAQANPTNATNFPVTVTFTEPVTGFTLSGITVTNGTATALTGSGASYTFTLTPTANTTATVAIAAGVATDVAGNTNTAATNFTITHDNVAPTVSLTAASTPAFFNFAPFTTTITFSEPVTGFVVGDLSVTNGTATNFVSVSSTTYTADITPTAQGAVQVNVAATAASDAAGNGNTAASPLTRTYDNIAPTVSNVTASTADGTYSSGANISITIAFSESVTVTGTPQLALNSGGTATYSSGSGSATLIFSYTVGGADTASDLDYSSTSALTLSGGTIKDQATNAAVLTLPTPGSSGSLGFNKNLVIAQGPTISSVAPNSAGIGGGDTIVITGTNFVSPTVSIGGSSCTVTASTSTSITCNTTAHASGAVTAVVTSSAQNSNAVGFTYRFTKELGVASAATRVNATARDTTSTGGSVGFLVTAGYTTGNLNGQTLTGTQDGFITVYNASGVHQWTRLLGAAGKVTEVKAVTADAYNQYVVVGNTTGAVGGAVIGTADVFVVAYDATTGAINWQKQLGAPGANSFAKAAVVDSSGQVALAGYTLGTFNGNAITGTEAMFVTYYTSTGVENFTKVLGGSVGAQVHGLGVGTDVSSGNIWVVGETSADLDGHTKTGNWDAFFTVYSPAGTKLITSLYGAAAASTKFTSIIDSYGANVVAAGTTTGAILGNTQMGTTDAVLTEFDSGLYTTNWSTQLGVAGKNVDVSSVQTSSDVARDITISGSVNGNLDGNTLTGTSSDLFLTHYNNTGVKQWTKMLGASGGDTFGLGLAIDASGNILVGGYATTGLDGNTHIGTDDGYLAKFSNAGVKQ